MKIITYITSCFIWLWFWINIIFYVLIALVLSFFLPPWLVDHLVMFICRMLTFSIFLFPKIRYTSDKKQPFPVIYVANHVSFFDLFISGSCLPGFPRGLELASHFKKPVYGWFITRFGQIPVDPSNKEKMLKSFDKAITLLHTKERNFFVMPEGTRTRDGKIGPFKYGAFLLAKRSGCPIVPVVYKNLYKLNNASSIKINPGTIDVVICDPINPGDFDTERELGNHVRNVMIDVMESP